MVDYLIISLLALGCVLGVLLTAVKLPGTWLIVLAGGLCGWATGWERITLTLLAILVGVALVAEVIELAASVVTARQAGASRRAAWGGLIGGFLGMFIFSLPLPVIGTIAGAVIGCFAGAMIGELSVKNELAQGTKVGFFSAVGYILGLVAKMTIAFAMSALLLTSVVCSAPASPSVDVQPASAESTTAP